MGNFFLSGGTFHGGEKRRTLKIQLPLRTTLVFYLGIKRKKGNHNEAGMELSSSRFPSFHAHKDALQRSGRAGGSRLRNGVTDIQNGF